MRAEVIDLFCGIGGLSAGFRNEGFDVRAGVDLDDTCQYAYETNIKAEFIHKSVSDLKVGDLLDIYSERSVKVLVGCAPCQPFSMYTGRYRQNETAEETDQRWAMLTEFARLIEETDPDVVSMENVVRVEVHPAFKKFVKRLEKAGYKVTKYKVRAQNYGVPQRRTRLVLFASKYGEVELAPPTHLENPVTVAEAIGDLPKLAAGGVDGVDRLHMSRGLGEKNLLRLRSTSEGGSWRDWSDDLQLDCHKKDGGKSFRAVYGRMKWDEPSPVITTQCLGIGNGRFGHPDQDRAISIREAAILQSFPRSFDFVEPSKPVVGVWLARQIGNAVPVKLGEAVARSIRRHLNRAEALPRMRWAKKTVSQR